MEVEGRRMMGLTHGREEGDNRLWEGLEKVEEASDL
jgi:hypothetical protein